MKPNERLSIDAGTAAKLLILAEMLNAAENPLPTEEWGEEDDNGIFIATGG